MFQDVGCELKQRRLEAEEQLTQKKLWLKQQEAQDNERSLVDPGAVLESLERALKATEAAFLEMASSTQMKAFSSTKSFGLSVLINCLF